MKGRALAIYSLKSREKNFQKGVTVAPVFRGFSWTQKLTMPAVRTASVLDPLEGSYERGFSWLLFSPDGSCILSTSLDAPAKLWDVHTKRTILSLEAHMNLVYAASFSPDGRYIASGYEDGTVRIWNAENGACLAIFTEHTGRVTRIVFSRDGQTLCSAAADGSVYMKRMCAVLQH